MTTSLAEKYEQHSTPINKEGGKCWLVVSVVVSPHDAPRDQHGVPRMQFIGEPIPRKMERMVFQVDGFTTLDAEILEDGEHMRIICNQTHLPREVHRGFSEERAFQGSHFANGKVITWDELAAAVVQFVRLANMRAGAQHIVVMGEGSMQ